MPRTSRRTLALAKLRQEIREFEEEQSFKLLFDDDPLDVVDLLIEDDLKQKYERLNSQRFQHLDKGKGDTQQNNCKASGVVRAWDRHAECPISVSSLNSISGDREEGIDEACH